MRALPFLFRTLLLSLLILGILAKPVLAAACEIHDVQRVAADAFQGGPEAASRSGQEERCCSLPDCNDCCAHTVALLPALDVVRTEPATAALLSSLSVEFEPAAFAVAFRPPIKA